MKTQISGNSFREDKQFCGVYLQQGRMLLDADWNEQVDISKTALRDAAADIIGTGIPKDGGVTIDTNGRIAPGIFYADGERVALKSPVDLLKSLPAVPSSQELVFYADVFEREITAVEDGEIGDPALYGADTCSRTRQVVQSRWIKKPLFNGLGKTGQSRCSIRRMADVDPCLFRLEIHDVNLSQKQLTLKWSFENGAEQYRAAETPKNFAAGSWVYEYFDADSEGFYGFNPPGSTLQRPALTLNIDDNPGNHAFVKRWDGFATISYSQVAGGVFKTGCSVFTVSPQRPPAGSQSGSGYWRLHRVRFGRGCFLCESGITPGGAFPGHERPFCGGLLADPGPSAVSRAAAGPGPAGRL